MEKPKKKSFWQVLGRITIADVMCFVGMGITDWINKVEFSWSLLGSRLIAMVIVILILSFLVYKVQKE